MGQRLFGWVMGRKLLFRKKGRYRWYFQLGRTGQNLPGRNHRQGENFFRKNKIYGTNIFRKNLGVGDFLKIKGGEYLFDFLLLN